MRNVGMNLLACLTKIPEKRENPLENGDPELFDEILEFTEFTTEDIPVGKDGKTEVVLNVGKILTNIFYLNSTASRNPTEDNCCWIWNGYYDKRGDPQIKVSGKLMRPARYSYLCRFQRIPEGMNVLPLCGDKRCCNPNHLRLNPKGDNSLTRHPIPMDDEAFSCNIFIVPKISIKTKELCKSKNKQDIPYVLIAGLNEAVRITGIRKQTLKKYTHHRTRVFDYEAYRRGCDNYPFRKINPKL